MIGAAHGPGPAVAQHAGSAAKLDVLRWRVVSRSPAGWQHFEVRLPGREGMVCKHRIGRVARDTASYFLEEHSLDDNYITVVTNFLDIASASLVCLGGGAAQLGELAFDAGLRDWLLGASDGATASGLRARWQRAREIRAAKREAKRYSTSGAISTAPGGREAKAGTKSPAKRGGRKPAAGYHALANCAEEGEHEPHYRRLGRTRADVDCVNDAAGEGGALG